MSCAPNAPGRNDEARALPPAARDARRLCARPAARGLRHTLRRVLDDHHRRTLRLPARGRRPAGPQVRLADYDTRRLVPVDSLWIVHGDFPTPMAGGLAAFARREAAEQVANETHGTLHRFAELPGGAAR